MLLNPKNGEKIYRILPDSANMTNQSKISKSLIFWTIGLKFCMCLLLMHTNTAILSKFYSSLPIFLYFAKFQRNLQRLTNFCHKSKSYGRILTKFQGDVGIDFAIQCLKFQPPSSSQYCHAFIFMLKFQFSPYFDEIFRLVHFLTQKDEYILKI